LLYLLPAEGFGGAERQGVYHLAELPRHGVRVTAFVGPGDPIVRAMEAAGVNHERFEHFPALAPGPKGPLANLMYFAHWVRSLHHATAEVERRVRGHAFDLIFANRTFAWLVAASLSRRLGVPYAIRAGSRPVVPALTAALPLLDDIAPPAALFANCRAVERAVGSYLRCPAYPLPNAVDVGLFAPASRPLANQARKRLGLPLDTPLIGLAARPCPGKGFALFERVAALIHREYPSARFAVAGDFGWRERYEARFSAAGLGETVRFLGRVDAMSDFFRAMDLVLLTSRSRSIEASPNALLEAMAAGLPIVATSVGGVPEIVRDGRNGYLVADGDVSAFVHRVLELLRAPARREAFGAAGRAYALSHHRTSAVVSEFVRSLREVVSSSAVPTMPREGAFSCESSTRFVPRSIYSFAKLPSRPNS
jgi:glycosyltransferase involved in cell wall biosynthesis